MQQRQPVRSLVLITALSLASAACGADQAVSTNPELTTDDVHTNGLDGPVMRHLDAVSNQGEDAEVAGTLALEEACLFLQWEGDPDVASLVVWPHETGWDDDNQAVLLPNGDRVEVGDDVYGGGGYYAVAEVEAVAGPDAAARAEQCRELRPNSEVAVVNNQGDAIKRVEPPATDDATETEESAGLSSLLTVERGAAADKPQTDPGPGEIKLWISNQSFDDDPVKVTVALAGERVVSEPFEVQDQHNWIAFDITGLDPGVHTVEATSDTGAVLSAEFTLPDGEPRWLVLDYWFYPDDGEGRFFTFTESDIPVGFD